MPGEERGASYCALGLLENRKVPVVTMIPTGPQLIPLASQVCKVCSYPLELLSCTRQEAKPRKKGQAREVNWLAQGHTALTGEARA